MLRTNIVSRWLRPIVGFWSRLRLLPVWHTQTQERGRQEKVGNTENSDSTQQTGCSIDNAGQALAYCRCLNEAQVCLVNLNGASWQNLVALVTWTHANNVLSRLFKSKTREADYCNRVEVRDVVIYWPVRWISLILTQCKKDEWREITACRFFFWFFFWHVISEREGWL